MKKSIKLLFFTTILGFAFTITACSFFNVSPKKYKKQNTENPTNTPVINSPEIIEDKLEASQIPLTLKAITNGKIILSGKNAFEKVQFQKNDDLIIDATDNISVQSGDIIRFYGCNYKYKDTGTINLTIDSTADCYVYGNVMSLIYYTDFAGKTEITEKYVLQKLFINNTHIKNHESLDLVLPATTLTTGCYKLMFYGCTGLIKAPVLPAPTLTDLCYYGMFRNCTNLNYIKCLATDISASNCTSGWVINVSDSGNFISTQETNIWTLKDWASGIPFGWTSDPFLSVVNAKQIPLTLEAIEEGTIIITNPEKFINFNYTKNGNERMPVTDTIEVSTGDVICFFAEGPNQESNTNRTNIGCTADCYIYGNIMSLLDSENFSTKTNIEKKYCFYELFKDNTHIKTHSTELVLPALSLNLNCYSFMFQGCTSITSLPENLLPALSLASSCYSSMFQGCTGITSLPANLLPAITLAYSCYKSMFQDCIGITSLPANFLPAISLGYYCYSSMFQGCTQLYELPANLLPATTLAVYCYGSMFKNCDGLWWDPPANLLPATTLASRCYESMFQNCGNLWEIPNDFLPATTLADFCYMSMFKGCDHLCNIPANLLPATTLADSCYKSMFQDCGNLWELPADFLPATTLANFCYDSMFKNCDGLYELPSNFLPALNLTEGCYEFMFENCSNLTGELPSKLLPSTTLATSCYEGMFWGCKKITKSPELPAKYFYGIGSCYAAMFYDCSSLVYIQCSATGTIDEFAFVRDWVKGVSSSGAFYCPASAVWTENSSSGIPSGWTRYDIF